MAERRGASRGNQRPSFDRLDTVLSDDGEGYDVLPLPSPGMEPESPPMMEIPGFLPRIPYMSIYSSPSRMIVGINAGYLAKTPITVKILETSRDTSFRHPLNPYLYTIEVRHGQFRWLIYKRFNHFRELHDNLWAHRTALMLPIPTRRHMEKRRTRKVSKEKEPKMPRFPKRPDMWVSAENISKRQELLEAYLNGLLQSSMYKNHHSTKKFLEVSRFSFIQDIGIKGKEGVIRKRSGGHRINLYFCEKCCNLRCRDVFTKWSNRWFVVKDTFIMYLQPSKEAIKGVILFDNKLKVQRREHSHKLLISNSSRKLMVDCWTDRQAKLWERCIKETVEDLASDFVKDNPHRSYAPIREAPAHWFVDGSSYFAAVADAIEKAKEEIFITDWWLSPQIYLKRPMTEGDKWQLDKLLKRKADEGVKIYVLLYKEVEMAVALDSSYTKHTLQALNPKNIRVLRHPDHMAATADSLLWAHHEKIVVIDQSVAFIGGIDLCYGRWDNENHVLTDMGGYPGEDPGEDVVDTQGKSIFGATSNMTSALIMCQAMTVAVVEEVTRDKVDSTGDENELDLRPLSTSSDERDPQDIHVEVQEQVTKNDDEIDSAPIPAPANGKRIIIKQEQSTLLAVADADSEDERDNEGPSHAGETYRGMVENIKHVMQSKLWVGKDYCNFIAKDLTNLDDPYNDQIDRTKMPRMPWHDIACVTYGKPARDAARHFIQRWNHTKIEKAKKGESVPFLLPKSYADECFYTSKNDIHPDAVNAKVQVLRSSCAWSVGISEPEQSIHTAYITAINNAEHYIYIENQFFISVRNNPHISNKIVDALYHRIMRAHQEKKKFRVYVVMPLIPGFEGDISNSGKSLAIQAVMDWQYKSTNRGEGSLMGDLTSKIGPISSNYLSFCGLRTHSELQGKPITEIIYVHSKMLIVDDRYVIIGSANINERSMTGVRDSEVALYVEDTEMIDSTMDGRPFKVGKFASRLRKRVFAEHLGLLPENYDGETDFEIKPNIDDIVSASFYKDVWMHTAAINTTIYEKVFKCVPSDFVRKFSEIENFQKGQMTDEDRMRKELEKVQGFLVLLPLFFLVDEPLTPEGLTKESIAPTSLWT